MTPRRIRELSFMGRMLRFHVLSATPSLYLKPRRQGYIIIAIILIILAVAQWLG